MTTILKTRRNRNFGWTPDLPDMRDQAYAAPFRFFMPSAVDLRPKCGPVYDQGDLGSCTANAIASLIQFCQIKQNLPNFVSSRLFIYYNEREMEGTINEDAGAMLRDGIKSVAKVGAPREIPVWPYDPTRFATRPVRVAYQDAAKHRVLQYQRVNRNLLQLKGCLASGFPFVFGFSVYESFDSDEVARSGKAPIPKASEGHIGGHAVKAVGYDESAGVFICKNSYGESWGQKGYFVLPYDYLMNENLSDDFWTIKLVT